MELLLIALALILGIIWGLYFNISIAFFLVFLFIIYFLSNKKYGKYILLFIVIFIISYIKISILEGDFKEKYSKVDGNVNIVGTIISEKKTSDYKCTYILKVENINKDIFYYNTKILLNIKSDNCDLKYGDEIQIFGNLEDPSVARNENGFNYKEYLKQKGIYKIINIKKDSVKLIKSNNINFVDRMATNTRDGIKEACKKILPEKEASFLIGVLIGGKSEIDDEIIQDFRNSSLSHILAVSGMHVSYVIIVLGFIISKVKIGRKTQKVIIIILLLFFILLTGRTPSVERACIMAIYMIFGSLMHKKTNALNSLCFSIIIILIINPYNLFDLGFELSFGGTIGILFIYPLIKKFIEDKVKIKNEVIKKIANISLVTISANIILFPIILYYFNKISIFFVISNLLISPFIGIVIVLGFIVIILYYLFFFIAQILSIPLKLVIDIVLSIASVIGNLPFSQINFITPKIYIIVIYYIIISLVIIKKYKKIKFTKEFKKVISILLIIVFLFNLICLKVVSKSLKIYFVDVGQGDCTLIVTPTNKKILIDGGGAENYSVGENILIPFLLDKGIIKIDFVMISHFDSDHVRWNSRYNGTFKSWSSYY